MYIVMSNVMSIVMSDVMSKRNISIFRSNPLPTSACTLMKMRASFETSVKCYYATRVI
jgi:hypothetical protein